jgi:predicted MFS family arabinose efflux permease
VKFLFRILNVVVIGVFAIFFYYFLIDYNHHASRAAGYILLAIGIVKITSFYIFKYFFDRKADYDDL